MTDSDVSSRLRRLSPGDHARMILTPILVGVAAASLLVTGSDRVSLSFFCLTLACILGHQTYTAWTDVDNTGRDAS